MTRRKPRAKIRYGRIFILAVLLISYIGVGGVLGFVVGAVRNMPKYDIENITGELSSFVFDRDEQEITKLRTEKNRVQLDPNEVPKIMKEALVSIEDQRFYKHHGFDPIRFGGAVIANIREGYGAEGGSTLTQQLVKIAVLENPEKKLRRKIQEAIIAFQVEGKYSKEQILTMYLNNVYYGHGAHSLQTAAQVYFGKNAQDLNLEEAAMLAGVINAPGRYSPYLNMERAKQRQALVLNEMVDMNFISAEAAQAAKEAPLNLVGLKENNYEYQSYIDFIIDEAIEKLDLNDRDISSLYTAGYKIYTTMDKKTQDQAEKAYSNDKFFPPDKNDKVVQSAMVVLDPHSGEVTALIGGRKQEGERQFNRAVNAYRQPGSSIKPIVVYAPALEKGYGPATVLDDYPQEYSTPAGPKVFINYDEKTRGYRGLISMRTAIQWSVNTVAVKMLEKIGITEGFNFAEKLGITSLVDSGSANDMGLSLALGGLTKGVSPLEMAAAYGTFANQGIYIKPHVIRRIEDSEGNLLYEHKTVKTVVMSPQTAYLITDMLRTVVDAGTAGAARMNRPVAGKTGTTSFDVDAWFCGYTPELVGVVWMGFDKEEAMSGVYGGSVCGPIWKDVMTAAHKDVPVTQFPAPDGIVELQVDYKSGLLPSPLTPPEQVVTEKFNTAYVPTEISNVWIQLPVCAESGQLLTDFCPWPVTRVFLQRPIPWSGKWTPLDANLEPPREYCTIHGRGNIYTPIKLQGYPITTQQGELRSVQLTWTHPADLSSETVFKIFRSTSPNVPINDSALAFSMNIGGATSWQDNTVTSGNRYYYKIISQDPKSTEQNLLISNEISVNTGLPASPGEQPDGLQAPKLTGSASISGNTVTLNLNWTPAAASRNIVYYIFRSEQANFDPGLSNQIAADRTIRETTWTDSGLSRGKSYFYRVIAFDTETKEQSPASNQIEVNLP
jgi:penicillin-binding protein 1A